MHCCRPEPHQNYLDKMSVWRLDSLSQWSLACEIMFYFSLGVFLFLGWLANSQVPCIRQPLPQPISTLQCSLFLVLLPWGQCKPVESNFVSISSGQGISGLRNLRFANLLQSYMTESHWNHFKSFEIMKTAWLLRSIFLCLPTPLWVTKLGNQIWTEMTSSVLQITCLWQRLEDRKKQYHFKIM